MPVTPARPSRHQRRTEETRTRLLDAGLQLFLEHGYEGPSTGAITERADLGAGTYYLHFRDKRSLYEAIVRRQLLVLREEWLDERTARRVGGVPSAEISLMVEMVLESLLADLALARLILLQGPPLETWLVEDIGREMTRLLKDRVSAPDIVANLVIGATLNAARGAVVASRPVSTKKLISTAVAFCAAGVAALNTKNRK